MTTAAGEPGTRAPQGASAAAGTTRPRHIRTAPPGRIVIFGASGDLAKRKLVPSLLNLEADGVLPDDFAIVGYARRDWDTAAFRAEMRSAVESFSRVAPVDDALWQRFAQRLHFVQGDYDDPAALGRLTEQLNTLGRAGRLLFYLSLPPSVSESLLRAMQHPALPAEDSERPCVLIEKPFGTDLASAQRLNRLLDATFGESRVYRADHYLAKDTVRNLLVLRFTNAIFEPLWNRRYVDHVQITAAESLGIEGRGSYYEESGVVRDMVQNHVLQVLALIAMEPPVAGDEESARDKTLEVFKSLEPVRPGDFVFGQYRGYREEPHVAPGSTTPTYVALRLALNNWRWKGVPFFVRSGKSMARKVTEVIIEFKDVPTCVLDDHEACSVLRRNQLVIRIQPNEGIRLSFNAKRPGRADEIEHAEMDFRYASFGLPLPEAYERILLDALCGIPTLFWRADCVEAAWRAVEPLLAGPDAAVAATLPNYDPGSWGPAEAEQLLRRERRSWHLTY